MFQDNNRLTTPIQNNIYLDELYKSYKTNNINLSNDSQIPVKLNTG